MGLLFLQGSTDLNPRELFANNEQGLWLDPSDMTATKAGWRRNLLSYTEQFDVSGTWGVGAVSVAANNATAPDGTTTADTVTESATTDYHRLNNGNISRTSGITYTLSVYAKLGTGTRFLIINSASAINAMAAFNLSTGAVHSTTSGSAAIQSVGSGWYRCSVTGTATITGTSTIYFQLDDNGTDGTYAGDGSSSLLLWGAQLELGSTPSEYQRITDFSTEFKAAFPTHTLYQDSNGVTPCTAAGDPVGLIIDQSRGGLSQIGADLVTNGTFAADTDWTKGANWTIGSGVATKTGGAANNLTQTIGSTAAAWYRISLDVTRSAGTLTVSLGTSGTTYAITATGSYTFFILAGSGTQTLTLAGDSSFAGTVDNVVVRNVPGNHAYQTTSASRPTLARIPSSGRRNLLTRTEEFDNAPWNASAVGATVTPNTSTGPFGGTVADTISFTTTGLRYGDYTSPVALVGRTFTFSCWLASTTGKSTIVLRLTNSSNGADNTRTAINLTSTLTRYSVTRTFTDAGSTVQIGFDNRTALGGDGVAGDVIVFGAQLEESASATNYQKVVATTDVTESGVGDLWHLVFDGSDDSLTTNSVDMTGTAQMTVIAGVRKLSDAARGTVCELTATSASNNGAFHLTAPNAASATYAFESKGTLLTDGVASSVTAPLTSVISGSADISADTNVIRVNGSQSDSDTGDQGTGNYSNASIYIGRRGSSSLPFNGHLYQLIIRGRTTTTGKLLEAERFVARKTGVSF